jgi:hypothetical protein
MDRACKANKQAINEDFETSISHRCWFFYVNFSPRRDQYTPFTKGAQCANSAIAENIWKNLFGFDSSHEQTATGPSYDDLSNSEEKRACEH